MPEIDFDPQHKRSGSDAFEFDRLKLKKDERARIVLLEKPTFAYVHTLRAPKIVNGKATKVEKETRKGDTYVDFDLDFIGRPLCNGDYGTIADKGLDPANCPACKRATETDEVNAPERRFALNVVRYAMTRDNKLVQPFACQNLVWTFTETTFNRLIEIAQEHGRLVGKDLLLGPCTNESFQKFEIQAGAQNLWQADDNVKKTVVATYEANKVADLERTCGRKAETRWMVKDIDTIAERWRIARGEKDATEPAGSAFDKGMADLLGNPNHGSKVDATPADIGGMLDEPATPKTDDEPSAISSAKPSNVSDDPFDFQDVLDGLK